MPLPTWVGPLVRVIVTELAPYFVDTWRAVRRPADDAASLDLAEVAFSTGTCPASCPAPSLEFCLGPVRDALRAWASAGESFVCNHLGFCLLVVFALGFLTARAHASWTAPARAPRPHGRPEPGRRDEHRLGLHDGGR